MGYFSSGTQGMDYEESLCVRCVHRGDEDGPGCPIWMMHFIYNAGQCADGMTDVLGIKNQLHGPTLECLLDDLIPSDDGRNGKCRMFHATAPEEAA